MYQAKKLLEEARWAEKVRYGIEANRSGVIRVSLFHTSAQI
jgi:hypothetical protein